MPRTLPAVGLLLLSAAVAAAQPPAIPPAAGAAHMPLLAEATPIPAADAGWILGVMSMLITALFGYLNNRLKVQTDDKLKQLADDLKGCQEKHGTAEKASAEALARVAHLERQNSGQQGMIDTLTTRIVGLVNAMHSQGLSAGTGSMTPLPSDSPPKG